MFDWRKTRLPKLEGEHEIISVFEMIINKTYELGFQFCSFTMSSQAPGHQTSPIHFDNYPKEWTTLYQRAHFSDVDPVIARCKHCVFPFVWDEQVFRSAPAMWDMAKSHGVHIGLSQAVHDFRGMFSILTLGRDKGAISPEELYTIAAQLLWMCHMMHAVVAQNFAEKPDVKPSCTLTPRETEILKWTAMGKTAEEVARIISISPRTVGFHVASILRKLEVTNKIAAVLRASKMGLF